MGNRKYTHNINKGDKMRGDRIIKELEEYRSCAVKEGTKVNIKDIYTVRRTSVEEYNFAIQSISEKQEREIKEYEIVRYDKKVKVLKCNCGGDCFVDGPGHYDIPIGFGFHPGSSKFSVDKIRYKGWFGQCEDCKKKVFGWYSKKVISLNPRSLNKRILNKQSI